MIGLSSIEKIIIKALEEKKIFIGYYMLCRYLNGKGYKRHGCNAGYKRPFTNGRDRLHPCPILCPNSTIYYSKVRYWCKKLEKEKKIFLEKKLHKDSKNLKSETKAHKLDLFVFVCLNEDIFKAFLLKNTLEGWILN